MLKLIQPQDSLLNRGGAMKDNLGKVPLALQQLGLAQMRAQDSGNQKLANEIQKKMDELLEQI